MSQIPYTLDEPQLELLLNLTFYLTLCTFKEPLTPSEAARRLDIPANIAHYRAKRLVEVGLLEAVPEGKGRYRSVAETFLVPHELASTLGESSLLLLDGILSKLHRAMIAQTERSHRELEQSEAPPAIKLSGHLDLNNDEARRYPGACHIVVTALSSAQYRRVTEAVIAILGEVHEEPGTKPCTLAFLAFDGPLKS